MEEQVKEINPKHPVFLYIIGGLSIFSGVILILIEVIMLSGHSIVSRLLQIPVIDTIIEEGQHGNYVYLMIRIALHAFCMYAVLLIFKMKRRGFFYFIGAQIILLLIPYLFLMSLGFSYLLISTGVSSIFSFFLIMLFSLYLPHMSKNKNP
jgi:hypothetical protein